MGCRLATVPAPHHLLALLCTRHIRWQDHRLDGHHINTASKSYRSERRASTSYSSERWQHKPRPRPVAHDPFCPRFTLHRHASYPRPLLTSTPPTLSPAKPDPPHPNAHRAAPQSLVDLPECALAQDLVDLDLVHEAVLLVGCLVHQPARLLDTLWMGGGEESRASQPVSKYRGHERRRQQPASKMVIFQHPFANLHVPLLAPPPLPLCHLTRDESGPLCPLPTPLCPSVLDPAPLTHGQAGLGNCRAVQAGQQAVLPGQQRVHAHL